MKLKREDVAFLNLALDGIPVSFPRRSEQSPTVVGALSHLMSKRVEELRVAAIEDVATCHLVNLATADPGPQRAAGCLDRTGHSAESPLDLLGHIGGRPEEDHPLKVRAVAIGAHAEVDVEEVAVPHSILRRASVTKPLVGPGVDCRVVRLGPRRRHAAGRHLVAKPAIDRPFGLADPCLQENAREDRLGDLHSTANARDLRRKLPSAQPGEKVLARGQPIAVRRPGQRLLENVPHPRGQPIGRSVGRTDVDGNGARVPPPQFANERRLDAAVVGHDAMEQPVGKTVGVESPDDRRPESVATVEERGGPHGAPAEGETQCRIRHPVRFPNEDEP